MSCRSRSDRPRRAATTSAHCHVTICRPGTRPCSESAHASRKYGSTAAQLTLSVATSRVVWARTSIAAGAADATVATPYAWRWEDDAGRARMMTWGGLAGAALHRLDGDLGRGTELLDEAIASLCYDARLLDACAYPDASYDLCGNQPVRRAHPTILH